jgi:hypothetical protein
MKRLFAVLILAVSLGGAAYINSTACCGDPFPKCYPTCQ